MKKDRGKFCPNISVSMMSSLDWIRFVLNGKIFSVHSNTHSRKAETCYRCHIGSAQYTSRKLKNALARLKYELWGSKKVYLLFPGISSDRFNSPEVSVTAKLVKLPLVMRILCSRALIQVLTIPLPIQIPTNKPRKATDNGLRAWAPATTWKSRLGLLGPGFGVSKPWML